MEYTYSYFKLCVRSLNRTYPCNIPQGNFLMGGQETHCLMELGTTVDNVLTDTPTCLTSQQTTVSWLQAPPSKATLVPSWLLELAWHIPTGAFAAPPAWNPMFHLLGSLLQVLSQILPLQWGLPCVSYLKLQPSCPQYLSPFPDFSPYNLSPSHILNISVILSIACLSPQ